MIAGVDVDYLDTRAVAAGIAFRDWPDDSIAAERVVSLPGIHPYKSGQFFTRELPCLLAVLRVLPPVEIVLIDGYVWLEKDRPGLGAHLYQSLDDRIPVIGVAKTRYLGAENVQEIARGKSKQPLYISAVGLSVSQAILRWAAVLFMVLCADTRPGDALDAQSENAKRTLKEAPDTAPVTDRITLARPRRRTRADDPVRFRDAFDEPWRIFARAHTSDAAPSKP